MASAQITSLHMAASKGDVARLKSILCHGADPNAVHKGRTPLHSAVTAGKAEAIAALVAAGADINARDDRSQTPLMAACSIGLSKGSASAIALVDLGADVNIVRDEDGNDALNYALMRCRPDVLKRLVAAGAPVDGRGPDRLTPLMKAAVEDRLDAVQALVAAGADLRRKCEVPWADGKTAEELAVREQKSAVADFLRTAREKLGGEVADPGTAVSPTPAKARRWYPSSPANASGAPKG
jgi:ankyrin repeat protein